jgi:hypothetical protein
MSPFLQLILKKLPALSLSLAVFGFDIALGIDIVGLPMGCISISIGGSLAEGF